LTTILEKCGVPLRILDIIEGIYAGGQVGADVSG